MASTVGIGIGVGMAIMVRVRLCLQPALDCDVDLT